MIASFERPVVDVPDLEEGVRFWGTFTGFEVPHVDSAGKFIGLGKHEIDGDISVRLLLQRVDHPIVSGSTHLDFKVRDVTKAIAEIEAIGKLRKNAAFYPNAENPDLERAVMQDPWGAPFCILRWPV
jgi:Glyoxalase-like domain